MEIKLGGCNKMLVCNILYKISTHTFEIQINVLILFNLMFGPACLYLYTVVKLKWLHICLFESSRQALRIIVAGVETAAHNWNAWRKHFHTRFVRGMIMILMEACCIWAQVMLKAEYGNNTGSKYWRSFLWCVILSILQFYSIIHVVNHVVL